MTSLVRQKAKEEKSKKYKFVGTTAAGLVLTASGVGLLGIPLVVMGGYFGYDWFKFRGKNGMRF